MEDFSTKHKGDIAEFRVITELLIRGYSVLTPCGDRLPYDIALDVGGALIKIQVKMAWYSKQDDFWCVDTRRSQTNRRRYKHTKYSMNDFDFLIAWIPEHDAFYVIPTETVMSFKSNISFVEPGAHSRPHRAHRSAEFRNRWDLLPRIDLTH